MESELALFNLPPRGFVCTSLKHFNSCITPVKTRSKDPGGSVKCLYFYFPEKVPESQRKSWIQLMERRAEIMLRGPYQRQARSPEWIHFSSSEMGVQEPARFTRSYIGVGWREAVEVWRGCPGTLLWCFQADSNTEEETEEAPLDQEFPRLSL